MGLFKKKTVTKTYDKENKDGDGTFAESKTPTALIPHSPASPSIVSYVAMERSDWQCLITGRSF